MRLAIADPPYPAFVGSGGRKNRASRWYGTGQRSAKDVIADQHPDAHEWDNPYKHNEWTHWVLSALGYDPEQDSVTDLFSGSGAVSSAISSYVKETPK